MRKEPVAREIANDIFLKVLTKLHTFDHTKAPFMAWMRKIAVNTCLDKLKITARNHISESIYDDDALYDIVPADNLTAKDILTIMHSLPERQSVIFNLFVVEGYSHDEIAGMLQISPGNSRWYLADAKKRLRKLITEKEQIV